MKQIMNHGPAIHKTLQAFIREKKSEAGNNTLWANDFFTRLAPYATTGKLLRGCLVCFGYEAFSGQPADKNEAVMNAALAIELTHSALLMHDDIMDGDELRRGQPAMHRQYQTMGEGKGWHHPERFGVNMGICAGDATLFLAYGFLAQPGMNNRARQLFADHLAQTCFGQMQDIASEASPDTPTKRDIYKLMRAKTATYTLSLPLAMGAALAGQPWQTLRNLQAIGDTAGTIFQIRDDELGVVGDTSKTGKPVGADIREGKKTLIYYYLMKSCGADERQRLRAIFGNPNCMDDDIQYVQQSIKRHRIPELLNQDIATLQKRALTALKQLDVPATAKTELRSLVTFCATRQT